MIDRRAFAAASIASNASLVTTVVVGLLLAALVVRYLGAAQFGLWAILNTITHYAALASVGIPPAITWRAARERGAGRVRSSTDAILAGTVLMGVLGALVGLLTVASTDVISGFFRVPADLTLAFGSAVVALAAAIALGSVANAITAGLVGLERVVGSSLLSTAASISRLGLTFAFLDQGFGLPGAVWGYALSHLVVVCGGLPMVMAARDPGHWLRLRSTMLHFRPLLSFSAGAALLHVASMLANTSALVVSGHLLPAAEVAKVAVVMMLTGQMIGFVVATMRPLEPRLATLAGAHADAAHLMYRSLFLSAGLTSAILGVLVVLGRDILTLWLGPQYGAAHLPLAIAATAFSLGVAQVPTVQLIMAKARHRDYGWLVAFEALVNVLLTIVLTTRFGVVGAILGTAIPIALVRGLFIGVWGCRILGLDAGKYLISVLGPFLAASMTIAIGLLAHRFLGEGPLRNLLVGLPLLAVTFLTTLAVTTFLVDRRFGSDFAVFALSLLPPRIAAGATHLVQRRTPE